MGSCCCRLLCKKHKEDLQENQNKENEEKSILVEENKISQENDKNISNREMKEFNKKSIDDSIKINIEPDKKELINEIEGCYKNRLSGKWSYKHDEDCKLFDDLITRKIEQDYLERNIYSKFVFNQQESTLTFKTMELKVGDYLFPVKRTSLSQENFLVDAEDGTTRPLYKELEDIFQMSQEKKFDKIKDKDNEFEIDLRKSIYTDKKTNRNYLIKKK